MQHTDHQSRPLIASRHFHKTENLHSFQAVEYKSINAVSGRVEQRAWAGSAFSQPLHAVRKMMAQRRQTVPGSAMPWHLRRNVACQKIISSII
jgi:hypothetical protein